jgi:hypothetical protein
MSRRGKLKYDFDTTSVLEVCIDNKWFRVTSITFRSFGGPRRINNLEYNGNVYEYQTNTVYKGEPQSKTIHPDGIEKPLPENKNYMKRCLP